MLFAAQVRTESGARRRHGRGDAAAAALRGARRCAGGPLGPSAHDVGHGRGACGAARDTGDSGRARRAEHSGARGRRLPARPRRTLLSTRPPRPVCRICSAATPRSWSAPTPACAAPRPPCPASRDRLRAVRCSRSAGRFRCSPTRCCSRSPHCSYGRFPPYRRRPPPGDDGRHGIHDRAHQSSRLPAMVASR